MTKPSKEIILLVAIFIVVLCGNIYAYRHDYMNGKQASIEYLADQITEQKKKCKGYLVATPLIADGLTHGFDITCRDLKKVKK